MPPEAFTGRLPPVLTAFGKLSWASAAVVALSEAFIQRSHMIHGEKEKRETGKIPPQNLYII